jgi:hypothetical protein
MAFTLVDPVEERGERGTQVEAPTATVADFKNTPGLFFELRRIDWTNQSEASHVSPAESNQRPAISIREE